MCSHRAAAGQCLHELLSHTVPIAPGTRHTQSEGETRQGCDFFPCCMLRYAQAENLSKNMLEQPVSAFKVA